MGVRSAFAGRLPRVASRTSGPRDWSSWPCGTRQGISAMWRLASWGGGAFERVPALGPGATGRAIRPPPWVRQLEPTLLRRLLLLLLLLLLPPRLLLPLLLLLLCLLLLLFDVILHVAFLLLEL